MSWIHWDSGFRDSGLEVADRLIELDGKPLSLPDERERRKARDLMIGGLQESQLFAALELKDGSPLRVTVLRRTMPGRAGGGMRSQGQCARTHVLHGGRQVGAGAGWTGAPGSKCGRRFLDDLAKRTFDWRAFSMADGSASSTAAARSASTWT